MTVLDPHKRRSNGFLGAGVWGLVCVCVGTESTELSSPRPRDGFSPVCLSPFFSKVLL